MSLTWPWALIALLAFPLLLGYRWWMRRRRRRETVRVSSVALIRAALPGRSLWRRRIPLWLFARRAWSCSPPAPPGRRRRCRCRRTPPSILLAIDVSGSMCSTDVAPNRLTAAQEAAREFVEDQRGRHPDRPGHLLRHRRAAGRADHRQGELLDGDRHAAHRPAAPRSAWPSWPPSTRSPRSTRTSPPTGVEVATGSGGAPGDFQPDTIVVLTDGRNTQGVDPVTAAEAGGGPAPARLHDRLRHHRAARRWSARRTRSAATRRSAATGGGGGGFGGRGGRVPADRRGRR